MYTFCRLADTIICFVATRISTLFMYMYSFYFYLGWSAVIANLDDITAAFRARGELFEQSFKQHLDSREECLQLLDRFVDLISHDEFIHVIRLLLYNYFLLILSHCFKLSLCLVKNPAL